MKRVSFLSVFLLGLILECSQFSMINPESISHKDEQPYKAIVCTPSGEALKSVFDGLNSPPGFQFPPLFQPLNTKFVNHLPIGDTRAGLWFAKSNSQVHDCMLEHCDERCGFHYRYPEYADCQGWCGPREMGEYFDNYCTCVKYCYCSCGVCASYAEECECWDC